MRRAVVAVVLLAVAAGAFLWMQGRREREARDARRAATIMRYDERAVTAVDVEIAGEAYRFENTDDGWWLVEPMRDRASGEALSELMRLTRRSPVILRISDPEPPASYGLAPPRLVVRVEGVDAPAIRIGAVSPDGKGVYAALEGGDDVLLVEAWMGSVLVDPEIERFREAALVGLPATSIEEVELRGGRSPAATLRRGRDGWWVELPAVWPADDGAVRRLVDRLDTAEIVRFLDDVDPGDPVFGLGSDARTVVLRSDGGERTLVIGDVRDAGERYVHRDDRPPVLVVRGLDDGVVPTGPDALLATRLTKVNRYTVRAATYRRGATTVAMRRDENGWTVDGEPVDDAAVFGFLARALEAPVVSWETSSGGPPDRIDAELTWTLEDGSAGSIRYAGDRAWPDAVTAGHAVLRGPAPAPPTG